MSRYYKEIQGGLRQVYLSWEDYKVAITAFHEFLTRGIIMSSIAEDATGIYGPPRGGLVFATHLSNLLDLPLLQAPCDGMVIVEDIIDTGLQTKPLIEKYINKGTANLLCWVINKEITPQLKKDRVFWVEEKEPKDWIVFPWEWV